MNDSNIVKNIYYMLCYCYESIRQVDSSDVATESFENIHSLLASILIASILTQIKRRLHHDYFTKEEPLSGIRGKIEITKSANPQQLTKRQLVCQYDEFSENSLHNQVIKSTLVLLLRSGNVNTSIKYQLRKLITYFSCVTDLSPTSIRWDSLHYHRNNAGYKIIINICALIIKGLLLEEKAGSFRLSKWISDNQMSALYESFLLSYYQKEHPYLKPRASSIPWDLNEEPALSFLPVMKTDIVLSHRAKCLIIDAKWYSQTMKVHYKGQNAKYHSSNLYQIYTYVKNKDVDSSGNVAGMLLYAKTTEEITPNESYMIGGNSISLKTIDLNVSWGIIKQQLEEICHWVVAS